MKLNKSIMDWDQLVEDECFFIGLEVLDNFPHDKVMTWQGKRYEMTVQKGTNRQGESVFFEIPREVQDPHVSACLQLFEAQPLRERVTGKSLTESIRSGISRGLSSMVLEDVWLPTSALVFFQVLAKYFPNHRPILADFDYLPTRIPGYNAPLVQKKNKERKAVELGTYLVEEGSCDIFYPTEFAYLQLLYRSVTGRTSKFLKQSAFLREYGNIEETTLKSGWNPMLEEYKNVSILLSDGERKS